MKAFSQLNDSVLDLIRYEAQKTPALQEAVMLLDRIDRRDLVGNYFTIKELSSLPR